MVPGPVTIRSVLFALKKNGLLTLIGAAYADMKDRVQTELRRTSSGQPNGKKAKSGRLEKERAYL